MAFWEGIRLGHRVEFYMGVVTEDQLSFRASPPEETLSKTMQDQVEARMGQNSQHFMPNQPILNVFSKLLATNSTNHVSVCLLVYS